MKTGLVIGLTVGLASAFAAEAPQKPKEEKPPVETTGVSGATELFYDFSDRKQLEDFEDATGTWRVEDGALVGSGRGEFSIRLQKRLEGEISVSWEHSLKQPAQELGGYYGVNCGLELGDPGISRGSFWNAYWIRDVFRSSGPVGKGSFSKLPAGCRLGALYRDPARGGWFISHFDPSTKIRGQAIQLGQPRPFQLDVEYRQVGVESQQSETHVQLEGCGWKMKGKKVFEFKPHYVRLVACDCTVKFRNLRIRFGKSNVPPPVASTPVPPPVAPPPASASPPSSAAPLSAAESRAAAQLVNNYRNGLVFFAGPSGQGSGFITDYKGEKFLLSNAHVIGGIKGATFKLLDRTPVTAGAGSVAVGHDIVALKVTSGGTAIPMAKALDKEVAIGDPVVVLGNAEGAEVINTLGGRIVGIGADRIEVDAPVQPGNSGSPIIHLPTGKVIGIAAYIRTRRKFGEREVTIRRFGYRLDSVQQWQPIDWNLFYAEADALEKIKETTERLIEFLNQALLTGISGRMVPGARTAIHERLPPAAVGALDRFRRSTRSQADVEALMLSLCPTHAHEMHQGAQFTYGYFKDQFAKQKQIRNEVGDEFGKKLTR